MVGLGEPVLGRLTLDAGAREQFCGREKVA